MEGKKGKCKVEWYLSRNESDNASLIFNCEVEEDQENYILIIPPEFARLLDSHFKKKITLVNVRCK
jgi:hypothetical protein